ncbi:unnamed protein product [Gordionus sp. m RMFG-2023]
MLYMVYIHFNHVLYSLQTKPVNINISINDKNIKIRNINFASGEEYAKAIKMYAKDILEYEKIYRIKNPNFKNINISLLRFPFKFIIQPQLPICGETLSKEIVYLQDNTLGSKVFNMISGFIDKSQGKNMTNRYGRTKKYNRKTSPWILIVIHSSPNNWIRRAAIRETWGSRSSLSSIGKLSGNKKIVLRFFMGIPPSNTQDSLTRSQKALIAEANHYEDMVQMNFGDSYSNLTYKAFSWITWALKNCGHKDILANNSISADQQIPNKRHGENKNLGLPKFIIKTDDDMLLNLMTLVNHLKSLEKHNEYPKTSITCLVWKSMEVWRKGKWAIDPREYPYKYYPDYCSGSSYIMTGDALLPLYRHFFAFKYMWIDDVFMTGFLAHLANVKLINANRLYMVNLPEHNKSNLLYEMKILPDIPEYNLDPATFFKRAKSTLFAHIPNKKYRREIWEKINKDYGFVDFLYPFIHIKYHLGPYQYLAKIQGYKKYRKIRGLFNKKPH